MGREGTQARQVGWGSVDTVSEQAAQGRCSSLQAVVGAACRSGVSQFDPRLTLWIGSYRIRLLLEATALAPCWCFSLFVLSVRCTQQCYRDSSQVVLAVGALCCSMHAEAVQQHYEAAVLHVLASGCGLVQYAWCGPCRQRPTR